MLRTPRLRPCLLALALLFATFARPAAGAEYYLAPSGIKDNPGSKEAPWGSLQEAIWRMRAGDTLWVRGGTYHDASYGDLLLPSGGPVTAIRAYPGEKPIFDGRVAAADAVAGPWTDLGGGHWSNRLRHRQRGIDGLWIGGRYVAPVATPAELKPGTWHLAKSGVFRVAFPAGRTPENGALEFRREAMIIFDTPFWLLEGITASHYHRFGIGAWRTHHVTIRRCEALHNGGAGIETSEATDLLVEANTTSYNGVGDGPGWASGIHLFALTSPKNVVRGNVSHHNWDPSPHHTDGNGISVDKGGRTGGAELYDNLAYANGGRGLDVLETAHVHAHHNTFIDNARDPQMADQGELSVAGEPSLHGLNLHHNRLLASRTNPPLVVWQGLDPHEVKSDFNLFYNRDTPELAVGLYRSHLERMTLDRWRELSGQDGGSRVGDPRLVGNVTPGADLSGSAPGTAPAAPPPRRSKRR